MSDVVQNISICHLCIHRQKKGILCTINGQPFAENADDHDCPKGLFPCRGAGDALEKGLAVFGIGPAIKRTIEAVTGKPCGCKERKEALNALIPFGEGASQ